jgi:hypothetical protein
MDYQAGRSKMMSEHSTKAQCERLLQRLQEKPCTTVEARHELDILGVAPRIYELRHHYGYNIQTHWVDGKNPGGGQHRIAEYVLMEGRWRGAHE